MCFTLCIEKTKFPSAKQSLQLLADAGCRIGESAIGRRGAFMIEFGREQLDTVLDCAVQLILQDAMQEYIHRALDARYRYFNQDEKTAIAGRLCDGLEKAKLRMPLSAYLEQEKHVQLYGFVTFRMKEYFTVLDSDLELVVDEFLVKKEYLEFIKLLKFFVEVQESKYDVVHILPTDGYHYLMLDERGQPVQADDLEDAACEVAVLGLNENDMLLSTLISIAPKQIVIHHQAQFFSREILETIDSVFAGKVVFCTGCGLCGKNFDTEAQIAAKKE